MPAGGSQQAVSEHEWLRVTLSSIGDAVIVTDPCGVITFMNPVAVGLTGWQPQEAAGQPVEKVFRVINEETRESVESPVRRVLREGVVVGLANHTVLVAKDGQEIPIDDSGAPIRGESGAIAGVVLVFRDVTEARRAVEARLHLAAIVESSEDAIISKNLDGIITTWNKGAERLYGYTAEEVVGRPLAMLIPPDHPDELPAIIEQVKRGERVEHFETVRVRKDGSRVDVSLTISPVKNAAGKIVGASKIARNVTARNKAAEELRAQEQRFHTLTRHAPVGIFQTDAEGHCLFVNERWCDLAGLSHETAAGRGWVAALHPDDRERVFREWYGAAQAGREFASEYRFSTPGGQVTWLSGSAVALRDGRGQVTGYIGTVTDITHRKQAEQQLQIVTDTMSAPVTRCSRDLRYLWVSKPYADWIGRPAEEIVGRPIREVIGAEAFAKLRPHFDRVLRGEQVRYEDPVNFRGLGERWINAVYTPTRDTAGAVDGWVAVVIDIEERRRAEDRLRESEEKYRRIVETANEGIWTLDADARITFVNLRMAEMLGYTPDEMVGRQKSDFVTGDERQRVRELFERRRAGVSEQVDVCFRHKSGQPVWTIMSARPVTGDKGAFQGALDMFTDVTDRREAEETVRALLRISERLNSTLDVEALLDILVQEAIALVGAESGVSGLRTTEGMACKRYFQRGVAVPLEYCWPPMHGLPGWVMVRKGPYLTNDALSDTQIVHDLCLQFGVRSALCTPIITAQGEVVGFFEVHNTKDGSGFSQSDQELLVAVSQAAAIAVQNALAYRATRQAQEALQEADRHKDEFLAMLAHELRNPLAPIRNALHIMQQPGADAAVTQEVRDMAKRQVQHLARLLDDLLDVSRISRGKIELRREPLDVTVVVNRSAEAVRPLYEQRHHQLTVSLPRESLRVEGDPTRLEQVLTNLLNNAAKYTEPGGKVWLTAERTNGEAVIRVRDTGIGIDPVMLPRIFDLFVQADRRLERAQAGLGIGLTLVKKLVELHGGRVEVSSPGPGKGCEFVAFLPELSEQRLAKDERTGAGEDAALPCRRVLVVDDNRDAADSLAMMLRLAGQDVRLVYDGPSAVAEATGFGPHVVLLDIGMPGMDGYEVAKRMRELPELQSTVLVAVTGWGPGRRSEALVGSRIRRSHGQTGRAVGAAAVLRPSEARPAG